MPEAANHSLASRAGRLGAWYKGGGRAWCNGGPPPVLGPLRHHHGQERHEHFLLKRFGLLEQPYFIVKEWLATYPRSWYMPIFEAFDAERAHQSKRI
jgi:hypothetical protein